MHSKRTDEELARAKAMLPAPLRMFLESAELQNAYAELRQAHTLNLRQAGAVTDITMPILLGLEPESGLESALSSEIPELAPAARAALLVGINEKVFEAARAKLRAA